MTRTCFEVLYGGAAGGGKSDALLVDAIRYVGRGYGPGYRAILFRRTYADLEKAIFPRASELYPRLGGRFTASSKTWRFPGGERVDFGYLEHAKDISNYDGTDYQFIGFDELTHFTEAQYISLFARCRSARGIRCRIRAGTNPGNEGHEWVFARWGPWLDPESPVHAEAGEELYFVRDDDGVFRVVPRGSPLALDRTFIPARLEDNPSLFADGKYEAGLATLDLVRRAQLRRGDWLIKPSKGLYFRRDWFHFVDAAEVPRAARRIRYWDRAATEPGPGKDPDWTSGARIALTHDSRIFIEDVGRIRANPGDTANFVRSTAEMDGRGVSVGLEQEPGASGKADVAAYIRLLAGFHVRAYSKRVNKIVAAGPVSAQALARNVSIVRGPWNEVVLRTLEQFPEGTHDDDVDSIAGGYTALIDTPVTRYGFASTEPV